MKKAVCILLIVCLSVISCAAFCFAEDEDYVKEVEPSYTWNYNPDPSEIVCEEQLYVWHHNSISEELEVVAGSADGGYTFSLAQDGIILESDFEYFSFPSFLTVELNKGGQLHIDASNAKTGDTGFITYFVNGILFKLPVKVVDELGKISKKYSLDYVPAASTVKGTAQLYCSHIIIGDKKAVLEIAAGSIDGGYTFHISKDSDALSDARLYYFNVPSFLSASVGLGGQFNIDAGNAVIGDSGYITYFDYRSGIYYTLEVRIVEKIGQIAAEYLFDYIPLDNDIKETKQLYGMHRGEIVSALNLSLNSVDGGYKFFIDEDCSADIEFDYNHFYFPLFLKVTANDGGQFTIDATGSRLNDFGYITYFDYDTGIYYKLEVRIIEDEKNVKQEYPTEDENTYNIGDLYESFYPQDSEITERKPLYICHSGEFCSESTLYINSTESGFSFYTDMSADSRIEKDIAGKFYFPPFVKATISGPGGQFELDSTGALLYAEGPITYFKDGVLYTFTLIINGPRSLTKDMSSEEKQVLMRKNKAIAAQSVAEDIARIQGKAAENTDSVVTQPAIAVDDENTFDPINENFVKVNEYDVETFSDIDACGWYADNIKTAYELGLMNGISDNKFNPDATISLAETIALAARIHKIYYTGSNRFAQGSVWYEVYYNYAVENGIVSDGEYLDLTKKATREEFAQIISMAVPAEVLTSKNTVEDGAIPDVDMNSEYAEAIYKLYRAGIFTGNDAIGSFNPESTIGRSSVAATITRLIDNSLRKSVTLTLR